MREKSIDFIEKCSHGGFLRSCNFIKCFWSNISSITTVVCILYFLLNKSLIFFLTVHHPVNAWASSSKQSWFINLWDHSLDWLLWRTWGWTVNHSFSCCPKLVEWRWEDTARQEDENIRREGNEGSLMPWYCSTVVASVFYGNITSELMLIFLKIIGYWNL